MNAEVLVDAALIFGGICWAVALPCLAAAWWLHRRALKAATS